MIFKKFIRDEADLYPVSHMVGEDVRIEAEAALEKGLEMAGAGRMADSIVLFDHAIGLDHDYGDAYNCKGLVLTELKRYDQAFSCFERALKLQPQNPKYWYNKSILFRELGMFEDEAGACLMSLKYDSRSVQAWHSCARS